MSLFKNTESIFGFQVGKGSIRMMDDLLQAAAGKDVSVYDVRRKDIVSYDDFKKTLEW